MDHLIAVLCEAHPVYVTGPEKTGLIIYARYTCSYYGTQLSHVLDMLFTICKFYCIPYRVHMHDKIYVIIKYDST